MSDQWEMGRVYGGMKNLPFLLAECKFNIRMIIFKFRDITRTLNDI